MNHHRLPASSAPHTALLLAPLAKLYQGIHAAGGNLLLNVPPDRTGRIPEYHVKALMELKEEIK